MLYEVTHKPDRIVDPQDLLDSDYLKKALKGMHPASFEKICSTLDNALDRQKPSASSNLVWTKFGALAGPNSNEPVRDINHLWEKSTILFGDGKTLMKFLGVMLMWRISIRNETWLVYRQETKNVDQDTGKIIHVCNYWIDPSYEFEEDTSKPTLDNLLAKFNKGKVEKNNNLSSRSRK